MAKWPLQFDHFWTPTLVFDTFIFKLYCRWSKNFRHNSGLHSEKTAKIFIHAMLLIYLAVECDKWMKKQRENGISGREFLVLRFYMNCENKEKIGIPNFFAEKLWATFSSMMQNGAVMGILGRRNTFPRFLYIIKSPNIHVDVVYASFTSSGQLSRRVKMGLKAENYPSFTSTQMMMDTRKENNFKN